MNKILLIIAMLSFPHLTWAECKAEGPNQAAYNIKGMHCADCVKTISSYFSKQKSVAKADVNLKGQCMTLEFKADKSLSKAEVEAGLKKLGYELN